MIASLVLFENEFINIVSISFTALVLNELIMVAVEVQTWHTLMILSEVFTLGLYVVSILFLPEYFGAFLLSLPRTSLPRTSSADLCDDRPLFRPLPALRMESSPHRRHLRCAALGHQSPQGQVCADAVCKVEGFLGGGRNRAGRFSQEAGGRERAGFGGSSTREQSSARSGWVRSLAIASQGLSEWIPLFSPFSSVLDGDVVLPRSRSEFNGVPRRPFLRAGRPAPSTRVRRMFLR